MPRAADLAPLQAVPATQPALPARPAPPRELGKPEDDVRVDVLRYAVDADAPAELREALPRLTQPFVGKERSFEDLVNAAAEVTRFLQRELGYYLGYAYLPEQVPEDGVIRIAVLEGRLDRVVLNWPSGLPVDREIIEAYLARLVPGSILRVRDIERVVFLINDLRGINTRFEVRAGATPGTASLLVTPRAEGTWSGKVDLDGNGSRFIGPYRIGGLLQRNSPFGRGDGFTANALASTTGGMVFALLGYTTPLGSDGFKLGASLSAVQYQIDRNLIPLDLDGSAVTFNAYGLYPVVRSRNLNLFTLASYENKSYDDRKSGGAVVTKKTVDNIALGVTGDFRDSMLGGGVNTYEASLAAGQVRYTRGKDPSLDDAANFSKLNLGFTRLQDLLTGRMLVYASVRGQFTTQNLDTTEQFRLGGPEGVRAFAAGEGTGDSGAVLSLELRFLPPEEWFGRIAREMVAAVFYDTGVVRYRTTPRPASEDSDAQANHGTFSGVGVGLSWARPGEYALRVSLAKPLDGTPRSDTTVRDPRLYFVLTKLFN